MIFKRWILKVLLPQKAPSFIDSSLLSPQSFRESHICHFVMHFPFLHWNSPVSSHVRGFPEIETRKLIIPNSSKECWHTLLWQNFYWYWHIFDINFQSFIHDIFNQHKSEKKEKKKVSEHSLFYILIFHEIVFNFQLVFKTVLKWNKGIIYGNEETFYKIASIPTKDIFLIILRLQI